METITVKRDGSRNLKFTGELIASTESSANNAASNYSGSTGRCTELNLYRTKAGKFIGQRIDYTQWQGEHTTYSAEVCTNDAGVFDFFGGGRLAKGLYKLAGLDMTETVE